MAYPEVLAALEAQDLLAPSWGEAKAARCPAHDDNRASLSLSEGDDGRALLYCHAGCPITDVVSALGISMSDLFGQRGEDSAVVATYVYEGVSNEPLYRVMRLSPKGFYQERWEDGEWKPGMRDVVRVPYHLPQLVRLDPDQTVYIVEGEKDADNIIDRTDAFATTMGGASQAWREDDIAYLEDRPVCIIPDNDEPGLAAAERLRSRLAGVARSVTVQTAAVGKDVTTHLLAGLNLADLIEPNELSVFEPWDPYDYEPEDEEWLWKPYVPRAGRVLVYGASGSLKSLWAAWIGAHIAAEGGKVAYFSLEMPKRQYVQRFRQLQHIGFERGSYQTFGKFMFGMNLETAIKNFQGYDLLIVDSWSQAQGEMGGNDNDAISMMDADFFQPLVASTGATVLIIDNTGKDGRDNDGMKVRNDEARGASRKKDIQEVAWFLSRPDEGNNYRTRIVNRKMRLNEPAPAPITVETPQDRIEFYLVHSSIRTEQPLWDGLQVAADGGTTATDSSVPTTSAADSTTPMPTPSTQTLPGPTPAPSVVDAAPLSDEEALANLVGAGVVNARQLARMRDREAKREVQH